MNIHYEFPFLGMTSSEILTFQIPFLLKKINVDILKIAST